MASKKIKHLPMEERKRCIEMHRDLPISRQCKLIGIARSSYYYKPRAESELNIELMRLIDEQYTKSPFYGIPRMTAFLRNKGYKVNHKRVERLMRIMGIQAIHPKKRLSVHDNSHRIYPYLLKNLTISYPDQVWCSDITYIRMRKGFVYLTAVMDWYSRYILSWNLSISLDARFCVEALQDALLMGKPEIFNTDQGSQYTSTEFTSILEDAGTRISMDGRSRVFDNIFIERLWRSLKYEEVYLKDYNDVWEAEQGIRNYFMFYNTERLHSALGYKTPQQVYYEGRRLRPMGDKILSQQQETKLKFP